MNMDMSNVYSYVTTTPVYENIMLWHVIAFLLIGPSVTWPMLVLLLVIFGSQLTKVFGTTIPKITASVSTA